tara:strand:- start:1694 stop:3106 length:1413 start_codon:yes stop_codon:yes gene_type:complete
MALNPFFLQGSQSEQRLVQDLINEQLTIYGVEVTYIPRKVVNKKTIFREVTASKFDDNFLLEAYVNTYEGYDGQGDIMTKFGVSLKDELTLTISKERFEDFISPFMAGDSDITVSTRPEEGDLVYFPLGQRLFEVKFVEHEKPFYQLGKNYVYQLQCELFEYEDEVIDTSIDEIDETIEDQGFATDLVLFSLGTNAVGSAVTSANSGYVQKLWLNNDGYGYTKNPTVAITTSPTGDNATAVAITTSVSNIYSVKELLITNVGSGYTVVPTVTIVSAATTATNGVTTYHGVGAAATASLTTVGAGISFVGFSTVGAGYSYAPTVTFGTPSSGVGTATGTAFINNAGVVTSVYLSDAGIGYSTGTATITFSASQSVTGVGTYQFNEIVTGQNSGTTGRVKNWDIDTMVLRVGNENGVFYRGETIVGSASSAKYSIKSVPEGENLDKYDQNTDIETEADLILDFSESNPFGSV